MALMAGSYSECVWHGVLRDAGYPLYICLHRHNKQADAKECARRTKNYITETPDGTPLPSMWVHYQREIP
jgi:hypothetical protein